MRRFKEGTPEAIKHEGNLRQPVIHIICFLDEVDRVLFDFDYDIHTERLPLRIVKALKNKSMAKMSLIISPKPLFSFHNP